MMPTRSIKALGKIINFRQHVERKHVHHLRELWFESGCYEVRFVSSRRELRRVRRLRYRVFHREMGGARIPVGFDRQSFDHVADILMVVYKPTGKVVGTYRMLTFDDASASIYSSEEFHMENLLALPGRKVELSRACIHRKHRNGRVIQLLFKGVLKYLEAQGAQYAFGMSSIPVMSKSDLQSVWNYLDSTNSLGAKDSMVQPREDFKVRFDVEVKSMAAVQGGEKLVPGLLKSYLKAGAKVVSYPAFDGDFQCFDFLTVWDVSAMKSDRIRRLAS
jgi:putative hemolysin